MQRAATRVDSGLRHETLIALRSKVADLDAALAHYVAGGDRRQNENRVISIQQAIESLEWAIEHENASVIWDDSEEFSFYEKRPYLIAEPTCAESTGKLLLGPSNLARASFTYARSALTTPEESPPLRKIDLSSLRTECTTKYQTFTNQKIAAATTQEKERQARDIEHQRKWRLHVEVGPTNYNSVSLSISADGVSEEETLSPLGKVKHIDGNDAIFLELTWPDDPSKVRVTVNGQVWPASNWRTIGDSGSFGTKYLTEIAAELD